MPTDTGRDMDFLNNRVFVIDKAVGPTSFDVVAAFRKATRIRKVGHTGTLDPLAEGVLLVCAGVATRAVEHFMNLEKEYQFDVRLGVETSTLDAEGDVVREEPCPGFPAEQIVAAARTFVGEYDLRPPAYSALKKDGKRLYELARAGETPEVETRTVQIYDYEILAVDLPVVTCRVRCSRGTYVRSLAKDLGEKLGVPAHIAGIVRRRIGPFERAGAFPSDRLFSGDLTGLAGLPLRDALDFLPAAVLDRKALNALRYGMIPATRDVVRTIGAIGPDGSVRLLDESGELLAIGHRNAGRRRNPLQLVDTYRMFVDSAPGRPQSQAPRR